MGVLLHLSSRKANQGGRRKTKRPLSPTENRGIGSLGQRNETRTPMGLSFRFSPQPPVECLFPIPGLDQGMRHAGLSLEYSVDTVGQGPCSDRIPLAAAQRTCPRFSGW
jgi:hypothetical protein